MVTVAPVRRTPRRVQGSSTRRWVGWGFLAPFAVVFVFTLIAPIAYAVNLSLFQERLIGGTVFAGLDNYRFALRDPQFREALWRVVLFFLVQVPVMLAVSAFAALALDSARLRWSALYRISLFLPFAVPGVIAALMWGFVYGTDFGLVGNLNSTFGLSLPDLLSSRWVLAAMANISTWAFLGYNMLVMYSALRTVPRELYESAAIDGAGTFRVVRSIKLPAMRPAFVITLVFSVIGSFQLFNGPNILRTLSPNTIGTNFTPNMYAFNLSFAGQQYNYAAAIAIIMGVLTAVVAYVVQVAGIRNGGAR
ncbi:ABC transporter permease subunit [Kineococcus sp. R8]|uniref:ABC transporter permease subunit n=1 Tax=Kineococcus siccus TaxID=2696567 RepID=UPI0014123CCB|nr:ABC transporter permease subunit [Kineococcus siccus]